MFAKPGGAACNMACDYCYYLPKANLSPAGPARMPENILEAYIKQHIEACPADVIRFAWHGGEPTILGREYFRRIVAFQRRHRPMKQTVSNGLQTNGTLLNEDWCRFFADEGFAVGLSLDGPADIHDRHRRFKDGRPSIDQVLRGYDLLQLHGVSTDILCVVNRDNVRRPLEVYRFFKSLGAERIGFLPLVEALPGAEGEVSADSVPAGALGRFLCAIFDEWKRSDIGRIRVEIFEEALRTAYGQEPALCIFRPTCGDVPVIERNGDVYACDHFVDEAHLVGNIMASHLGEILESRAQRAFGESKESTLPRVCQACDVRALCHGGCPKDRFVKGPDGRPGLNYLCAGYKLFFRHCQPLLSEISALRSQAETLSVKKGEARDGKIGRNDPCPCGSGRKYKKCCLAG